MCVDCLKKIFTINHELVMITLNLKSNPTYNHRLCSVCLIINKQVQNEKLGYIRKKGF